MLLPHLPNNGVTGAPPPILSPASKRIAAFPRQQRRCPASGARVWSQRDFK